MQLVCIHFHSRVVLDHLLVSYFLVELSNANSFIRIDIFVDIKEHGRSK